jgi:hypothetical protein
MNSTTRCRLIRDLNAALCPLWLCKTLHLCCIPTALAVQTPVYAPLKEAAGVPTESVPSGALISHACSCSGCCAQVDVAMDHLGLPLFDWSVIVQSAIRLPWLKRVTLSLFKNTTTSGPAAEGGVIRRCVQKTLHALHVDSLMVRLQLREYATMARTPRDPTLTLHGTPPIASARPRLSQCTHIATAHPVLSAH